MPTLQAAAPLPVDTWPLLALDLLGVFVFALSGGLAGVRKQFDVLGVLVLAVAAGLGGGVLRDVLIGDVPPVNISDWRLFTTACAAGLITFFFHPGVAAIERFVLVLDGVGLAFFAVAGTLKALALGANPLTAVVVGVLTGVGGGIIRDLLSGEVPRVLAHRELYAIPAVIGATVFAVAWSAGHTGPVVVWGCVTLVGALRILALVRNWQAPAPRPPSW